MELFDHTSKHFQDMPPATWILVKIKDGFSAVISCPCCNQKMNLLEYVIDNRGMCTNKIIDSEIIECPQCHWYNKIKLSAWGRI